jgi:hypothetical protein
MRLSSLVSGPCDWPVYPRLRGTMQGSECARNSEPRWAARLVSFGCRRTGPSQTPASLTASSRWRRKAADWQEIAGLATTASPHHWAATAPDLEMVLTKVVSYLTEGTTP